MVPESGANTEGASFRNRLLADVLLQHIGHRARMDAGGVLDFCRTRPLRNMTQCGGGLWFVSGNFMADVNIPPHPFLRSGAHNGLQAFK